ncbi:MAG: response regulator transcription factor, partial [Chloroflexota bacterium]
AQAGLARCRGEKGEPMIGARECLRNRSDDSAARCHRRLEETMVMIRWIAVLLCLAILVVVPPAFLALGVLATAGLAAGNLTIMVCLCRAHQPHGYVAIGGIASVFEWLAAIGMIVACSATSPNPMPATLIILLVVSGVRYGLVGLIGAWIAAAFGIGCVIMLQVTTLHVLRPTLGTIALARWELVLLAALVVIALFLRLGGEWTHQIQDQWDGERAALLQRFDEEEGKWQEEHSALRRFQLGITPREWEILSAFADGLNYRGAADRLFISEETVRTHVHHLAAKLGLSHQQRHREAILAAAVDQDLLSPPPGMSLARPEAALAHLLAPLRFVQ